jgi:hypothetical protein
MNIRELTYKTALKMLKLQTAEHTFDLGRSFAQAIAKDWDNAESVQRIDKVALIAMPECGKSTFVKGLSSTFNNPVELEVMETEQERHRQTLWSIAEASLVRHADLGFLNSYPGRVLRAYRFNYLEEQGSGGVDLLENVHTARGIDPQSFDCAIEISKHMDNAGNRFRIAYIHATQEFSQRPGFQKFLEQASDKLEPYIVKPMPIAV